MLRELKMLRSGKYKLRHAWIGKITRGDYTHETREIRLNLYLEIVRTICHELRHAEIAESNVPISDEDEERAVLDYEDIRFKSLSVRSIKAIAREVMKQVGAI